MTVKRMDDDRWVISLEPIYSGIVYLESHLFGEFRCSYRSVRAGDNEWFKQYMEGEPWVMTGEGQYQMLADDKTAISQACLLLRRGFSVHFDSLEMIDFIRNMIERMGGLPSTATVLGFCEGFIQVKPGYKQVGCS